MKKRNILEITDVSAREFRRLIARAIYFSRRPRKSFRTLKGAHVGLLFDANSLRTKMSFEVATYKMGGIPYFIPLQSVTHEDGAPRESREDIIDTLDRFVDLYIVRDYSQEVMRVLMRKNDPPVFNGFSGVGHPSQALADIAVITKQKGDIRTLNICAVCPATGSGVIESFAYAVLLLGGDITFITPTGKFTGKNSCFYKHVDSFPGRLTVEKGIAAVQNADVLYVDEWWENTPNFLETAKPPVKYRVDEKFLKGTKDDLIIMHCLPAHHEREISSDVISSSRSIVFDEAEFRLYSAMAWLEFMAK